MAQIATPQAASTVVLIRPEFRGGFEIYLNRRPDKMETYAGVYVFPGGRVEESDYSEEMICLTRGLTPLEAQQRLGSELRAEICLGYWVAAVRELFEEAGIHFFVSRGGPGVELSGKKLFEHLASRRAALQRGEINLPKLLVSERLCCDVARLRYFFHRITPEHYAMRFDTRFYLAALPPDQTPLHASEEVAESLWSTPQAALERGQADGFRMMPPTVAVLRSLAAYSSWDALCDAFELHEDALVAE
jgi:8-oxo-dGTP pyrophosphatase MutT (NUDIX family)